MATRQLTVSNCESCISKTSFFIDYHRFVTYCLIPKFILKILNFFVMTLLTSLTKVTGYRWPIGLKIYFLSPSPYIFFILKEICVIILKNSIFTLLTKILDKCQELIQNLFSALKKEPRNILTKNRTFSPFSFEL